MPEDRLVVDLDGVFANFADGACEVHGRPEYVVTSWNFFKEWGLTPEEFWKPIRDEGTRFYEHIVQPYPWANELLTVCREFDKDFVFASVAGGDHPEDYSGKVKFVRKHFGDVPVIVLPGSSKYMLAGRNRILIDDADKNVSAWRGNGGMAITFPQPWNKAYTLLNHRVQYVRNILENIAKGSIQLLPGNVPERVTK